MPRLVDVAIIGGGPAGLHLAGRLAEAGFDALVLDDRPSIGHRKICSGIIGREAFQRYRLPEDVILSEIQDLAFHAPNGEQILYQHPEALASVVDRPTFDARLADISAAKGARIENFRRVRSLETASDRVRLRVADRREPNRCGWVESRFAVLATGVNLRLNRAAGLGEPRELLHAAQAYLRVKPLDRTHCFAGRDLAPGGFGWLVPLTPGWARVGMMAESRVQGRMEALVQKVTPFRSDPDASVEMSYKPIAQSFSGSSFADRIVAVGEAAGQVKTTTGGGIFFGLLGADAAFETLSGALTDGRSDRDYLSRYEAAWKQKILDEIETGYFYRKLYAKLSDRQINTLFRFANSNGLLPLVRRTARFDWHSDVLAKVARYNLVPSILGIGRRVS